MVRSVSFAVLAFVGAVVAGFVGAFLYVASSAREGTVVSLNGLVVFWPFVLVFAVLISAAVFYRSFRRRTPHTT